MSDAPESPFGGGYNQRMTLGRAIVYVLAHPWLRYGLLVPGLAQVIQRRPVRGVIAAASTFGAMLAGMLLLGRRFQFAELSIGPVPVCFPEALQVLPFAIGRSLVVEAGPMAERAARLPIEGESIGWFLSGLGAMVGLFWCADAVWIGNGSKRRAEARLSPPLAAAVSWLLPGVAHVLCGQRSKGLLIAGAMWGMFILAMVFSDGHAIDRGHYPIWWAGQNLFGGGSLVAALVTAPMVMTELPAYLDLGIVLCTVAGLLNVIVMSDAYGVADGSAPSVREADSGDASIDAEVAEATA